MAKSLPDPPIPKDNENYYHPNSEQEIIDLVNYARVNGVQLRVRGSGHSLARAIYTDVCEKDLIDVESKAPDGNNINIKLDKYNQLKTVTTTGLVTVESGIHLGEDPFDRTSTEKNSLLYQLHHDHGLAFGDLGGITHQTVSGFLSTGSSGGSLTYGVLESVESLRIIDGTGSVFTAHKGEDLFNAALVSMGLLGVLSQITFQCIPTFNIKGTQHSKLVNESHVDLYNDNPDPGSGKIGLTTYLNMTPYTRMLWYPQTSDKHEALQKERIQIWHAHRLDPADDFEPQPFKVFDSTEIMMLSSYLMTLMGNITNIQDVVDIMASKEKRFLDLMSAELREEQDMNIIQATIVAEVLNTVNKFLMSFVNQCFEKMTVDERLKMLPVLSTSVIALINKLDGTKDFQDYGFSGLPMDNAADDVIFPTMFTEIWIPMTYATQATSALRAYFDGSENSKDPFVRTGNYSWELYACKRTDAWLSMSYSNGSDVWKDGCFRIDPFWFVHNKSEAVAFFRPVWKLLADQKIPFRLHWGKILPSMEDVNLYDWRKLVIKDQYEHLSEFLEFRTQKDPNNIFLTSYWRYWFDISVTD